MKSGDRITGEITRRSNSGNGFLTVGITKFNIGPIIEDAVGNEDVPARIIDNRFACCEDESLRGEEYIGQLRQMVSDSIPKSVLAEDSDPDVAEIPDVGILLKQRSIESQTAGMEW